jgi:hypothetical protein
MSLSNYAENELLDHLLGKGLRNFTSPPVLAVALASAITGTDGATVTEFANANGYTRQAVTFGAAGSGSATNSADVTFDPATGDQGTVTHIAVYDNAAYGLGELLFYGALTASKTIQTGDTFEIKTSNLTVNLD